MQFALRPEQEAIRQTVREFAEKHVRPAAAELDREKRFPHEHVKRMADLGLLGMMVPPEHGGAGTDTVSYAIAIEEIARFCAATAVVASVNNSLYCWPVETYGSEAQKRRWLDPFARGERLGAYALSEPEAGSDPASMSTTATRKGHGYVLTGKKNFITNGGAADGYIVFAKTDPPKKHKGITAFLVEKGTPGFEISPPEHKMGIRAAHSTQLFFTGCEVSEDQRLGPEGEGFKIAMKTLDGGRIGIAAQAVGIARGCLEESLHYAKERKQFGKPIGSFQMIQQKVADMATEVDAARLLLWRAAARKDRGGPYGIEASMAKLYASTVAMKAAIQAVQIFGGSGYTTDHPVERYMRDAKITEIYEGTSEVQHLVIARNLLRDVLG
ncbi:MAG: acyl-CoA dehydrogenase [Methanobacteriota archaeon]